MSRGVTVPLRPIPPGDVRVTDPFWGPRQSLVAHSMLPHQWRQLEMRGYLDNFTAVAPGGAGTHRGPSFVDSDLYKWLEAAAYTLGNGALDAASVEGRELAGWVERAVDTISRAPMPDGYLNTYQQAIGGRRRWTSLLVDHELYCAGHLIEAGCALDESGVTDELLGTATRFADHIVEHFASPSRGVPGHEEVELALVRLAKRTGQDDYLAMAAEFVHRRGRHNRYPSALVKDVVRAARTAFEVRRRLVSGALADEEAQDEVTFGFEPGPWRSLPRVAGQFLTGAYFQDRVPLTDLAVAEGHAVRAGYLFAGAGDVALAREDEALGARLAAIWERTTGRRAYVTGGMGSLPIVEGFGRDYELPNRGYAETCAAIAGFLWSWRMLLLSGESRYAEWMERALHNAVLSGVSLGGDRYFYQNPLVSHGEDRRRPWYAVACCPPNIARIIASLGRYLVTQSDDGLQIHQPIGASVRLQVAGSEVDVDVDSKLPAAGRISVSVRALPAARFDLSIRAPAWAGGLATTVDGETEPAQVGEDGYLRLNRVWRDSTVELAFDVRTRLTVAHPSVRENRGRMVVENGPFVHCLQGTDNTGVNVHEARLVTADPERAGEIAGAPTLALAISRGGRAVSIPYFAWANEGPTDMAVWIAS